MNKERRLPKKLMEEVHNMRETKNILVCPKLTTREDYAKQREKSRSDFEQFVEKRNSAKKATYFEEEKKRM